jgi:hypothetical protein
VDEVRFEAFDSSELDAWIRRSNDAYIEERVAAGDTFEEASKNAEISMERTFPGGSPAPGQLAGRVLCDGRGAGELWVGLSRMIRRAGGFGMWS